MLACLEVSVQVIQAMREVDRVDQFHAISMEEIRQGVASLRPGPERVGEVAKHWGGQPALCPLPRRCSARCRLTRVRPGGRQVLRLADTPPLRSVAPAHPKVHQ